MKSAYSFQAFFRYVLSLLMGSPGPRVYDGNPSAGAEPSPAEQEYDAAKEGAKTGHENVVSHTWRW